jgi:hypothetical protein
MVVNESFMLPVLRRYKGQAGVDAAGNILYSFPELQPTAKVISCAWLCRGFMGPSSSFEMLPLPERLIYAAGQVQGAQGICGP